jgi:flagellar basal body-associated protein FliL
MSAIEIPLGGKILAIFLAVGVVFLLAAWPLLMRWLSKKFKSAFGKREVKSEETEENSIRGEVLPEEPRFKKAA